MKALGAACLIIGVLLLGFFGLPILIPIVFVLGFGFVLAAAGILLAAGAYALWRKLRHV